MAVFKCKMCGGTLEISEGSSICTCEFCETQQTIPTIQDEGLQNLFNRANVLRMKSEFDKAAEIYEKILQKSSEESEAYWGLILCKYGIEYVEDPDTYKRIPTCHRASYDSVIADEDYKMALQYADMSQKSIYEEEAKVIDEVQKGIIELAQKADPYDVFICYKETDENGQRTQDSVIANDIYYQLTQEGFKVFYAAITLEDKLGSEYEPYIFSALNTSKVLLSIGTKPEYFNAVWVKNEWSRFLKIMKKDRSKMLIPCYKDMDAYELPEEFAHLQAQNMGKIGFINDLVRGIKKVIVKEDTNKSTTGTTAAQTAYSSNVQALLDRGHMALEDSEWDKADNFFEEVLNQDAKCAEAYLGKLLAANRVDTLNNYFSKLENKYLSDECEFLYACREETEHINTVVKENALAKYLEEDTIRKLYVFDRTYSSTLSCRKEQKKKQQFEIESDKLLSRVRQYASGDLKEQVETGIEKLIAVHDARIKEAKDLDEEKIAALKTKYQTLIAEADRKAHELRIEADSKKHKYYESLVAEMNDATTVHLYENARDEFQALGSYEDSSELAKKCQSEIDRLREEERKENERLSRKERKIAIIVSIIAIVAVIFSVVLDKVIIPPVKYNKAVELENAGQYEEAITAFKNLNGYKNSDSEIQKCETAISDKKYEDAMQLKNNGQYEEAITVFMALNGYKDSATEIENCKYEDAMQLKNNGQYELALIAFKALNGYKDSSDQIIEIIHSTDYINTLSIGDTFLFGIYEGKEIEWTILDKQDGKVLVITKDAVTQKAYNDKYTSVTWSKCSLRKWLNNDFLKKTFSSEEQSRILSTTVNADKNPEYSTNPGKATEDKVFLLSINEVEKYFKSDNERICMYDHSACWWWLRCPGYVQDNAACVRNGGLVGCVGGPVASDDYAVRPALWLNLES